MSKKKYLWEIGSPPPNIDPHSQNKHKVYAGYLKRYIKKLTQNPRHPSFKLFIVDGFCGGGVYRETSGTEHLGSPFIVFSAVGEALNAAQNERRNTINARLYYYFVDEDEKAIDYLKAEHEERATNATTNYPIKYFNKKFEDIYQKIVADIQSIAPGTQRVLFLLDQYGWSKVSLRVINDIISKISHAEIILTFTPDEIIDFLGEGSIPKFTKKFIDIGIDITPDELLSIRQSEAHPNKWIERMLAQEALSDLIKRNTYAAYFTRYYIKNVNSHRCLMLIHLSSHQTAHNEMVEEHWANSNMHLNHQGYIGISPFAMLGYNHEYDRQLQFFGNNFFAEQRTAIVDGIMRQIPPVLNAYSNGISFGELMHQFRNEAPITSDIMKDVIRKLIEQKEIDVIHHKTGKRRTRFSGGLHPDDQVKLRCQGSLFHI